MNWLFSIYLYLTGERIFRGWAFERNLPLYFPNCNLRMLKAHIKLKQEQNSKKKNPSRIHHWIHILKTVAACSFPSNWTSAHYSFQWPWTFRRNCFQIVIKLTILIIWNLMLITVFIYVNSMCCILDVLIEEDNKLKKWHRNNRSILLPYMHLYMFKAGMLSNRTDTPLDEYLHLNDPYSK